MIPLAVLTIAGAAYATAVFVQMTKFIVNGAFKLEATNPNQNNVVRLYVFAVAVALCGGYAALTAPSFSRPLVLAVIEQGFGVAVGAITGYHLLAGDSSPLPALGTALVAGAVRTSPPVTETAPTDLPA